jgi:hypothetical protein
MVVSYRECARLQPLSSLSYLSICAIRARKSLIVRNPVYARRVDPSALTFSLSSHRNSYIGLLLSSGFIAS